eukprot:CAMPEP_0185906342 /NCGR_PEP_ID=MMETSP0196C-20130402/5439_1 /TAXON_ID=2932 /ORGANISM="Alexandrium fundyense, Strain CCMP1719" /LENGTH=32 /DNA_ID= /DNA_START= /DNA_END= /DNA_ORIENTATION=
MSSSSSSSRSASEGASPTKSSWGRFVLLLSAV